MLLQHLANHGHRLSCDPLNLAAAMQGDALVIAEQAHIRISAKEGIASYLFAAFHRFQQERIWFIRGER